MYFFIKKNLKHLECIWVSVEAGRSFCATPMGATCHLPLPGLWGVHRACSSLLQSSLSSLLQLLPDKSGRRSKERCPEHSLFSTGQGGQGPWGGPSTLRTAQALPCQAGQSWALEGSDSCSTGSQGRPGARVSKHLPFLTGTPASQRTRPGRQCVRSYATSAGAAGAGGAERMNHWLPGGWCLGRERRAASEAQARPLRPSCYLCHQRPGLTQWRPDSKPTQRGLAHF